MENIDKLSDQHLTAYLAKINDKIVELMEEINECQQIKTKVLSVQQDRSEAKLKYKQLGLFS